MRLAKALFSLVCVQCMAQAAYSQKLDPNPDRIFTTPLKWERIAGAPHSERKRVAYGTLALFYLEGVYAEVAASFLRTNEKEPVGLNLNEGFIVRLGTWSRTDDDRLVRIESRDVFRDKPVRKMSCKTVEGKETCTPDPEPPLPGPTVYRTCRLEQPSTVHIADTIVCSKGAMMSHLRSSISLGDFPNIVRRLVAAQARQE
jgi:hypothetical protein